MVSLSLYSLRMIIIHREILWNPKKFRVSTAQVDLPILFQDKEPLLEGETLTVQSRTAVPTDFSSGEDWSWRLRQCPDFDPRQPTIWLLEGLMMRPGC